MITLQSQENIEQFFNDNWDNFTPYDEKEITKVYKDAFGDNFKVVFVKDCEKDCGCGFPEATFSIMEEWVKEGGVGDRPAISYSAAFFKDDAANIIRWDSFRTEAEGVVTDIGSGEVKKAYLFQAFWINYNQDHQEHEEIGGVTPENAEGLWSVALSNNVLFWIGDAEKVIILKRPDTEEVYNNEK